jgi:hypothetical protein
VHSSVPRRGKSNVSSIIARPATYRAPIDVDRAFFSKLLADQNLLGVLEGLLCPVFLSQENYINPMVAFLQVGDSDGKVDLLDS